MRAIVVVVSIALLVVLAGVLTGCGATVRGAAADAPRIATPIVVDEALKAGEDAQTRQRFERVLDTPEMVAVIREVARVAVASALTESTTGDSKRRVDEMSDALATALADHLRRDVIPALITSVKAEMTEEQMHRMTIAVASMASAATRAAMKEASSEIPDTIGPAVRTSMAAELKSPELRESLRIIASDMAREAVLSSQRAMNEESLSGPGIVDRMRRMLSLSLFLALASGVVAVALFAFIMNQRRRSQRYRKAILELIDRLSATKGDDDAYSARMRRMMELIT